MQSGVVVLVVDDDESVRRSLVRLLGASGYVSHGAAPTEDVVQLVADHRATVIILDLHMRVTNGLELARRLRSVSHADRLWLIALSASVPDGDEALSIFDRILSKPCPADLLFAAIERADSTAS